MTDYTPAVWAKSPNYWQGRNGHAISGIVLHGTAGPGAVSWFQNPSSQVSAHYVIDTDGTVYQTVLEQDAAWHAGIVTGNSAFASGPNPNYWTIGIEHIRDVTNTSPITSAQQKASVALVQDIKRRYSITQLIYHDEIDVGRVCPGPGFLPKSLYSAMPVPAGTSLHFVLSPDENPGDTGTTAGGFIERNQNMKVANLLLTALRRCGQSVSYDASITYVERVARANTANADVLVACAHNATNDPAAEGTVFVFATAAAHNFGKQTLAAQNIGAELVKAGVANRWTTYDEPVVECNDFNNDSVYIEFLFQTNARDVTKMREPSYHMAAAEAACRGLASTYWFTYVPVASPYFFGNFNGTCQHTPLWFYNGPSFASGQKYLSAATIGASLSFETWTYGDSVIDPSTHAIDRRWFLRNDVAGGWVPSGWINGNPPNSTP